ncbi:MAG: DUF4440 domain-containing protein [Rhizomicrobium sp.]|jgi:ketosteroid isomerase-like protein
MIRIAVITALLLSAAPAFASDQSDITAAINNMNTAMNKNDTKAAAAYYTADGVILDEFPPHVWSGANVYDHWAADFDTYSKAHGDTDALVTISKPSHVTAGGDRGYAVVPALYTYKEHGKKVTEHGLWTFAMQKIGGVWKIAGWAWAPR